MPVSMSVERALSGPAMMGRLWMSRMEATLIMRVSSSLTGFFMFSKSLVRLLMGKIRG